MRRAAAKSGVFKLVEGLKPANPDILADYDNEMAREGIPKIIRDVEDRQRLADDSRHRGLLR